MEDVKEEKRKEMKIDWNSLETYWLKRYEEDYVPKR